MSNKTNESAPFHNNINHSSATSKYYDIGVIFLIIFGLPANVLTGVVASKLLHIAVVPLNSVSKTFHVLVIWNVATNGLANAWGSFVVAARQDLINLRNRTTCNVFGFISNWLTMVTIWLPFLTSLSRYRIAKATIEPWSVMKTNIISALMTTAMACISLVPFTPSISYHLLRLDGCTKKTNDTDTQYRILTNLLRNGPIIMTTTVYGAIFLQYRKLRQKATPENEQHHSEVLAMWRSAKEEKRLTLLMFATVMHLCITGMLGAIFLNFHHVAGMMETGCLLKNAYHTVTPFIISLSSGRYRREIRKIFCKQ